MGFVSADLELINGKDLILSEEGYLPREDVRSKNVVAMVDSGAYTLCINEDICNQLGLRKITDISVELADSTQTTYKMVGPVELKFANRRCSVEAMVLPGTSQVLLGAIPMEYMDVVINMRDEKLTVNPEHPYRPVLKVKSLKY